MFKKIENLSLNQNEMWAAANKIRYEYSSFSFISKTAKHLLAAISAIR